MAAWWECVEETRILVAPDNSGIGDSSGQLLSLQHPKTGKKTSYLLTNGSLQEIHWFKQPYGSWFLGEYVCEDGSLYSATPVDPVFILLPIFEEARMKKGDDPGKFRQLDEIIYVNGYPGYQHLLPIAEKCMSVVCDYTDLGSTKFFRVNDAKVLTWLNYKVNQLKKALLTLDRNYAARDENDTLADAVSILGEYLKDETWLKLLCSHLKLDLQKTVKVQEVDAIPTATESSPASFEPTQVTSGTDKRATRSANQTKKAKVETNSRNIKDMFSRATRSGKK